MPVTTVRESGVAYLHCTIPGFTIRGVIQTLISVPVKGIFFKFWLWAPSSEVLVQLGQDFGAPPTYTTSFFELTDGLGINDTFYSLSGTLVTTYEWKKMSERAIKQPCEVCNKQSWTKLGIWCIIWPFA